MGAIETLSFWVRNLDPSAFERLMDERQGKGTLMEAVKTVFFSSVLPAAATALVFTLLGILFGAMFGALFALAGSSSGNASGGLFGLGFGLIYIVLGVLSAAFQLIFAPLFFLIGQGVHWVLAKIMGGKGSFREQAYFGSFIYAGYATLSVLAFVPCVGSLVLMAVLLLILYLTFLMLKRVHQLDSVRAVAVIVIPIVLILALYIGLILLLRIY